MPFTGSVSDRFFNSSTASADITGVVLAAGGVGAIGLGSLLSVGRTVTLAGAADNNGSATAAAPAGNIANMAAITNMPAMNPRAAANTTQDESGRVRLSGLGDKFHLRALAHHSGQLQGVPIRQANTAV